jgi:multiple sugar transport system permease protein
MSVPPNPHLRVPPAQVAGAPAARTGVLHLGLGARRALWAFAFLFVPLLFFLTIRLGPAFSSLYISLHEWNIISPDKPFVGMRNFQTIFADPRFGRAAANTVRYVAVGIPLQLALGLLLALALLRITRCRGLLRALYFMPFITPTVAAAWVWQWMYSQNFGPLNQVLTAMGLPAQPFLRSPSQALYAVTAMIVWQYLGFQIVIFLAGLEAIPRVYYEAAEVDGASGWRLFCHITLPLLNPTLVFSVVYSTIVYLQLFTQVLNMTFQDQGGPLSSTLTLVLYVFQLGFQRFKMGEAAAATAVLFTVILIITLLQIKVLSKPVEY